MRLLEIDRICFVEGIAYSEEEMRYFLDRPCAVRLVGEQEGRIQGFIIADRFRPRRSRQFMGKIITIDVLPEARRAGLGSRLLNAAEDKLRAAGCAYVSLETAVDNLSAMHFYKKHGYTGLKILPNYYLDSLDALLMGKTL
ncbi:MAG TPA: N-acetyltransferase [Candidatus Angelobacter sp.]|nr:N-acetyltransferase [Candidatus Angelobacter sp.]